MWGWLFFGLFVAGAAAFVFIYRRQERLIAEITKAREKIQIEEERVFDFLHGLGEAFTGEVRAAELHRMIVEGAARVLDAHGGALYLIDRDGSMLMPSFVSKSCPPFVEVPRHILQQAESTPIALQSYLRLHAIEPGDGLIGSVWNEGVPLRIDAHDTRLTGLRDTTLKTQAVILSPLSYRGQKLGVLALANGPMGDAFTETDVAVFKAIAEQSAFALYTVAIYSEANEKKRMDVDLQVAQDIQRILLPSAAPQMEGYEVAGINIPARHVSGDYFGYIRIDEQRWGVAIADVSGKGVPASLIMAMCRSVLRSHAAGNTSPASVLHKVNRELYPDIKEDMFISMAYVILDDASGEVALCRAGHDAPLLYRAGDQSVSRLNPQGMALGIDSGDVFNRITGDFSVTLERDDCLILYTDGVTEALDSRGQEFGMKRTIQSIQASVAGGASDIVAKLTGDLREFVGATPQNDDITLIVIRKK